MARPDDDAVIGFIERLGQRSNFLWELGRRWAWTLDCRGPGNEVNGWRRMSVRWKYPSFRIYCLCGGVFGAECLEL